MKITRPLVLAMSLALGLSATGVPNLPAPDTPPASVVVGDVEGNGWKAALACIGCAVAGIAIVASGNGFLALGMALASKGSTLAVAGCITACYYALK